MYTQKQAQDLYEKLSTVLDALSIEDQEATYCIHWLQSCDQFGHKTCSHRCLMVLNNGGCALDEARTLIQEIENE